MQYKLETLKMQYKVWDKVLLIEEDKSTEVLIIDYNFTHDVYTVEYEYKGYKIRGVNIPPEQLKPLGEENEH